MEAIGVIASIIAAVFGALGYWNSKHCVRKRIARMETEINKINRRLVYRYGLNDCGRGRPMDKDDLRKERLLKEVEDLKQEL